MATTAALRGKPITEAASVRRVHVITGLLGVLFTLGSHVDGWAHTHLSLGDEGFFTPWHGILYSGWLGTAAWIYLHRHLPGYRLGLIGAIGFGIGGIFDMVWHTAFGIEVDMEALISPPHLLLVTMHLLMVSTPLRSAWNSDMTRRVGWREFTPVALSLVSCVALVTFITPYAVPFNDYLPSVNFSEGTFAPETRFRLAQEGGMLTYFATVLLFVAPLLAILKRWRPPFGTATLTIGLSAIGSMVVDPLLLGAPILAVSGIAAGLLADILIAETDPGPDRRRPLLAFGAFVPLPLVALSLLAIEIEWGLGWGVNFVIGSLVIASLIGCGLALVVAAPERKEVIA